MTTEQLAPASGPGACLRYGLVLAAAGVLLSGCAGRADVAADVAWGSTMPQAVVRPVVIDRERHELSLQYLQDRYGIEQAEPTITPRMVVVHWTAIPTLEATLEALNASVLPGARADIATAGALNVAAQYVVDRDGTIYQLLPETYFARHVIGLNHSAIGIENVGNGTDFPLTDAQLESNLAIIRYLHAKYGIEYLLGHYEYTMFEGHPLWMETDGDYRTEKFDPGADFMRRLRVQLDDLALNGPPGTEKTPQ